MNAGNRTKTDPPGNVPESVTVTTRWPLLFRLVLKLAPNVARWPLPVL
jgi:hypothetical protein